MRQYKLISLLALFFMASGQTSMAQFKVLASSGTSKINATPAKVGIPVSATDNISVSAQSYISLLHTKSGGTVEISKAGTYQAATLEKELLKKASSSTSQRYANYIIGELTKAGDQDIHKNPYKYSNVTGSVERGETGDILVLMPKTAPALESEYLIQWNSLPGSTGYILEIRNDFDDLAKVIETKDTFALVNLNIPELEGFDIAKMQIISANDKGATSIFFALTKPEEESFTKIQKEFKSLNLSDNPNAGEKLEAAQFFEDRNYIADAIKAYQEAITSDPSFEPFQIAFKQFLIRQGILDPKKLQNKEGE